MAKVTTSSTRPDGADLTGSLVGTTGGAAGVARSTDALTLTLPAATVTSITNAGTTVTVSGASIATVNAEHTVTSSTSTTIVFSVSGLDTAVTGGGTDPASEATIKVSAPDGVTDPSRQTVKKETVNVTVGSY